MGLWQKFKIWISGSSRSTSGGSSSSRSSGGGSSRSSRSYSGGGSYSRGGSYGGGYYTGSRYSSNKREEEERRKREKQREEKRKEAFKATSQKFSSIFDKDASDNSATDLKKQKIAESRQQNLSKLKTVVDANRAYNEKAKNYGATEKEQREFLRASDKDKAKLLEQRKKAYAREKAKADKRIQEKKEYHEATQHRFDVKGAKDKAEELKRRQNVKSRTYDKNTALAEEKHELKYHKKAYSAARGATSGATFGASDLLARKGRNKEVEEYYQKNKSKGAETAGEIGASLASFGLTSGASKAAVSKLAPKALKEGGEKFAVKLAKNKLVRKAAEKEVANAVKKGVIKEGSKELIEKAAKNKAKDIVANLAEDAAVNVTTGGLMDFNKATAEHKVGSKEWWKEMGTSAAMNVGLGTAATVGLPAAGKGVKRALGGVSGETDDAIKAVVKNKGNVKISLNRKGRSAKVLNKIDNIATQSNEVASSKVAKAELGTKGETWLGSYGHITKNDNGTYNLFVNGVGDTTLNEREALDYIDNAVKKINADEERIRVTRQTPLSETEKARVSEIDSEISRLEAEGSVQANAVKDNKYKGVEDYWDEQAERGRKITELANEKRQIETKEPNFGRADNVAKEAPRKPNEVLEGYSSVGSKKKISAAQKRADELIAQGDVQGARAEIERVIDDVVSNTKTKEPLDSTRQEIKDFISETPIKVSNKDKVDAGYLSGGYNEFRKNNFGNLKLKNDGTPVDVLWLELQERFGTTLFPEEITSTSDQLQYLANLSKAKAVAYDLADDEAAYLKEELFRSMWGDEVPTQSFTDEELAALEGQIPIEEVNANGTVESRPRATNEPVDIEGKYAMVDEGAEGINPDTPMDEARARLDDMAEGRKNNVFDEVAEGADEVTDELPKGVKKSRESYEKIHGKEVGKGEQPPTTEEIFDAYKDYHVSQGMESRRKQSKAAASQINAMTTDAEKELRQRLVEQGDLDYDVIFTPELYDQISNELKENGEYWINRIIDGADDIKKISIDEAPEMQARCEYLMAVLDPSSNESANDAYEAAFKLSKDIASKSGQTLNIRRNFVKLTRAGKIESTVDDFVNILDSSIGFNKKHNLPQGKYNRINYIKGVIMDDPAMKKAIMAVADAKTPEEVTEAYTEAMLQLNKQNPKGAFDIVQEVRYLNMLGNPKTHIRNIFGSGFFAPMRQVSNMIRGVVEDSLLKNAKYADMDITRHGGLSLGAVKEAWAKNPTTDAGKAAKEALERRATDLLGSAKYGTQQYKGRGKTIFGKGLDALSDFNSTLLTKEDDAFKKIAFKENYIKMYNRYAKDGKPLTEKVLRKIENEALQEAQIATFNEYNSFAKWLQNITKNATDANASVGARWGGRFVNALMPFEKVPANLMEQSINYSPLGIARGLSGIKKAAQAGDSQALNRAIDHLASGMTGTGIFGLGMLLGKTTDMFTTNAGKNDPAAKFKKGQGVQNYAITFKDPITNETHSYTLDWLVPTAATFFSGIEMSNQFKSGDFNPFSIAGDWSTVMSRLAEPVMETSMMSGLHSMLETMRSGYNGDDQKGALDILLRETTQSYLNSLIPTLAGQASRTAYKSDMQIAGDTDWEYFKNSLKSKAGLANTNILGEALGADTDLYGNVKNEKKNTADYVKSGLKNFLSPANIQKVDLSATDMEKIAQYEEAVKNGADPQDMAYLFPKKQYKKEFNRGDLDVKLSNRDLSTYNQAKTKGGSEGMRVALEGIMFNRYEKDAKGKRTVLVSGYTPEEKQELIRQFEGKSIREVEEWLYQNPTFRNAPEKAQKQVINRLWSLSNTNSKAQGSQRVGEQAVIEKQGGDVNEYNFNNEISEKKRSALSPLVAAGIITYEEAVDFARHAGKTYYYEDDEGGGSAKTYYNKSAMIDYLVKKGYSYEKAEALFNSFKASNAKPYNGNNKGSGYRRRGYRRRGYRRYGRGGSKKSTLSTTASKAPKAYKANNTSLASAKTVVALNEKSPKAKLPKAKSAKIKPPNVKFKSYEI